MKRQEGQFAPLGCVLLLFGACLLVPSCKYNLDRTWPDASAHDLDAATEQADSQLIQFPDKRPSDKHAEKRPPDRPVPRH